MMRFINRIVIHCSATPEGKVVTAADIDAMHKDRGFKFAPPNDAGMTHIGYHFFIRLDGTVEKGRPLGHAGAHVQGFNANSIGICYAGGLDKAGKGKDTRTPAQKAAIAKLVRELAVEYRVKPQNITGHRDLSPDTNHNGKVDKWEWLKECPCFEVAAERDTWMQCRA